LPIPCIPRALARGAYQGSVEEEARLFYTALTRAERFLYVSGSSHLPGGKQIRRPSQFASYFAGLRVSPNKEIHVAGLERHTPVRRVDETIVPTSYSEIRYYLTCPRDYQFRQIFGFSPSISELFGYGLTIHTAISKLHDIYIDRAPSPDEAQALAEEVFHLKHVPQSRDPENRPGAYETAKAKATEIVREYAIQYHDDFAHRKQVEVKFEVPVEGAVIAGAIDLMLNVDDTGHIEGADIIDFKTMEGGEDPLSNSEIEWTDLALQVQLYAKAAKEVLDERAKTGSVHMLKDNQRVYVPITDEAVTNAVANVEWAVDRIINEDYPARPHRRKCGDCDFKLLCSKRPQSFAQSSEPPKIMLPGNAERRKVRAFTEFEE
jgi:DNA helicase II / ATP-dependent DNA helicase PcrA